MFHSHDPYTLYLCVYPELDRIREVSVHVAKAVVRVADEQGHAKVPLTDDLEAHIRALMFEPVYETHV